MRILVTGLSGFLGRHLAAVCLEAGDDVCGIQLDDGSGIDGIREQRVDILDKGRLGEVVQGLEPNVIIHLAGLSHVGKSWDRIADYYAVNIQGVENIVEAAGGAHILLASSCEVYGLVSEEDQPIAETRDPAPRNPYAVTKAVAEKFVLGAGGTVVRIFNVVGPGQHPSFALPSFARQLATLRTEPEGKEAVLRVGNLDPRRDLLHVRDAANALHYLAKKRVRGEVFNLASGQAVSIREALDRLREIAGVEVRVEVDPELLRPVDVPLISADIEKLRSLGWAPKRTLTAALEDLWRSVASTGVERSTP